MTVHYPKQSAAAAKTPRRGRVNIYVGLDGKIYTKDENGVSVPAAPPSAGAPSILWRGGTPGNLFDVTQVSTTLSAVDAVITNADLPLTGLYQIQYSGLPGSPTYDIQSGDRILRTSATDPELNGIYTAGAGVWARASNANTFPEIQDGLVRWAYGAKLGLSGNEEDLAYRFLLWNPTNTPINIGTDPQEWLFAFNLGIPTLHDPLYGSYNVVVATGAIPLTGLGTVNSYSLNDGDYVLATDQANPIDNGLYVASASAWERAPSADTGYEVVLGVVIPNVGGHAGEYWFCQGNGTTITPVVGVDAQVWRRLDAEATTGFGPVRIEMDFDEIAMVRSPFYGPTNSLAIINLPPITPESAGRRVSVRFNSGRKKLGVWGVSGLHVQPAGTDVVADGNPGQFMSVGVPFCSAIEFESDGLSTWNVLGGGFPVLAPGGFLNNIPVMFPQSVIADALGDAQV